MSLPRWLTRLLEKCRPPRRLALQPVYARGRRALRR